MMFSRTIEKYRMVAALPALPSHQSHPLIVVGPCATGLSLSGGAFMNLCFCTHSMHLVRNSASTDTFTAGRSCTLWTLPGLANSNNR
jgi:hypothetical protein